MRRILLFIIPLFLCFSAEARFIDRYESCTSSRGGAVLAGGEGFNRLYLNENGVIRELFQGRDGNFYLAQKPVGDAFRSELLTGRYASKVLRVNNMHTAPIYIRQNGQLYRLESNGHIKWEPRPATPEENARFAENSVRCTNSTASSGSSSGSSSSSSSGVDIVDNDDDPVDDGDDDGSVPICQLLGTCGSSSGGTSSSSGGTASSSGSSSGSTTSSSTSSSGGSSGGVNLARPSGLPWASGAWMADSSFMQQARGNRPLDICLVFGGGLRGSWNEVANPINPFVAKQLQHCHGAPRVLFAVALFPASGPNPEKDGCKVWKDVAEGKYDTVYRKLGQSLKSLNKPNMILRLGWELSHGYPWSLTNCSTPEQAGWYKAAHRHLVDLLRETYSNQFLVSWNFLKRASKLPLPLIQYYPGDEYIDFISVDYYDDSMTRGKTLEGFADHANDGSAQVPLGINQWLAFAKSTGKKLSFDEWGVSSDGPGKRGNGDNAAYIVGMYNFMRANSQYIGYELYFHGAGHVLGDGKNPRATQAYRQTFGAQ